MDFFSQNWATENAFPVQKPFSPTCVLLVDGKQINIWWGFEKLFRIYGLVCQNSLPQTYLVFC